MRAENKGLWGKYVNSLDLSATFWYGFMIVLLLSDASTMIHRNTRYIFFSSHGMVFFVSSFSRTLLLTSCFKQKFKLGYEKEIWGSKNVTSLTFIALYNSL
jgi:hypothetical protein